MKHDAITTRHHRQSTFGHWVLDKRLITQEPLEQSLENRQQTNLRLGELLAEWKRMTHCQIPGVMRGQRGLRLVTAIVAALIAPLPVYATEALVLRMSDAMQTIPAIQRQRGMQSLSERDLSRAAIRALPANKSSNFVNLNQLVTNKLLDPMLMFLEFKTTVKDIAYPVAATNLGRYDGPTTFYSICVYGSTGPCIGSVSVSGIDQRGTTYIVTVH